jgi:uncharacterized protein
MLVVLGGERLQAGQVSLIKLISQQIVVVLVVAPFILFGAISRFRWNDIGLAWPTPRRSILLLWPLLPYVGFFIAVASRHWPPQELVTKLVVNAILIGIGEELMFRGILLRAALTSFKLWPAVFLTSLMFGGAHTFNVFLTGRLDQAIIQALSATILGMFLAAVRLRTQSLFPAILAHASWNVAIFSFGVSNGASVAVAQFGLSRIWEPAAALTAFEFPLLLYAVFILNRSTEKQRNQLK